MIIMFAVTLVFLTSLWQVEGMHVKYVDLARSSCMV